MTISNDTECKVNVVVLNYNDASTTISYVKKLQEYDVIEHILVVDNCSTDDSFIQLSKIHSDKIEIIQSDKNGGYGYGNNYGVRFLVTKYKSKYIAISNPDVEISEVAIANCLYNLNRNTNCAVVAPMMKMPNMAKNYHCAWRVPSFWQYLLFTLEFLGKYGRKMFYSKDFFDDGDIAKVGCVAGSFLVVDAEKFVRAGMYDENIFLYCEETVLGIKLKKIGFDSILLRDQYFIHHHSISINKSISSINKQNELMWNSREYVLKNYYNSSSFKRFMVFLIKRVSLLENRVYQMLKAKLDYFRKK